MPETVKVDPFNRVSDPRWRLNNLYTITDKDGRIVPFRPNAEQSRFLDEIHTRNIILKARRVGFTTLCCLIYLDACLFKSNTNAAIIAHKLSDTKDFFKHKIKFPYDKLDEGLRQAVPAVQNAADSLAFGNDSSIRVSTSVRSGTLQYLHISEFGKLCAQAPERAREVVTGSLPTVSIGGFVVIESTAEGQDGPFFKMTQEAQRLADAKAALTPLDYKFHFTAWWMDPQNAIPGDASSVTVSIEAQRYFDELKSLGIELTPGQKGWYVKTEATMEGDMKREYPSTPKEAFEQALEGAYFSTQLAAATRQQRIGGFPYDPRYVVNTFWDLGRNDLNVIWLHQFVKGYHRFIGYYENSGEFIAHYVKWLRDWAEERDATFGDHYLPHDGDRESLWLEGGTKSVMEKLKFRPKFVEVVGAKMEAIEAARSIFPRCQFDEVGCGGPRGGLSRLRNYRKELDEERGIWRDRPRHDEASHGADAFMTFACARVSEGEIYAHKKGRDAYRGKPTSSRPPSAMSA